MFLVFFDLPSWMGLYICMTNGERLDVLRPAITTRMTYHIIYIPCIPRFKKGIIYRVSMSKHISRNPSICYDYSHIIQSKKVIFGHDNKKCPTCSYYIKKQLDYVHTYGTFCYVRGARRLPEWPKGPQGPKGPPALCKRQKEAGGVPRTSSTIYIFLYI